jgi:hypothetical protein
MYSLDDLIADIHSVYSFVLLKLNLSLISISSAGSENRRGLELA